MTHKIPYQGREHRKRKLSRSARLAQSDAGRRNLIAWHQAQDVAGDAIRTAVEGFRAQLFAELGERPTSSRRALAEIAVLNYSSILWVNKELNRRRHPDRMDLVERGSWATGNFLRCLKQLNLDARPKPRTLADLLVPKVEQNGANYPAKPL